MGHQRHVFVRRAQLAGMAWPRVHHLYAQQLLSGAGVVPLMQTLSSARATSPTLSGWWWVHCAAHACCLPDRPACNVGDLSQPTPMRKQHPVASGRARRLGLGVCSTMRQGLFPVHLMISQEKGLGCGCGDCTPSQAGSGKACWMGLRHPAALPACRPALATRLCSTAL